MEWSDAIILGIVQGITEFLPISSSGHLVLGEDLLGLQVKTLRSFDVVVHMGTLGAILLYFRKDVAMLFRTFLGFFGGKAEKGSRPLFFYIVLATVPVVILGVLLKDIMDEMFRDSSVVALWMMGAGFVFLLGEFVHTRVQKSSLTWLKALFIGIAQAIAIIPGVSRSGSTIVAGLFQGVSREEAARFSFLLGIPALAGAGILTALDGGSTWAETGVFALVLGFVFSFSFGMLSISFLMRYLKKHTLAIFAVYLIAISSIVLYHN